MADNKKIAQDVLAAVGGPSNVTKAAHCMTRLRLNLKDDTIPRDDAVKEIDGVLGVVRAGGQYQVIIGQNVPKVYDEVCRIGGFAAQAAIDENLDADAPKEKLTPKTVFSNILNYLAGTMTPLIPAILSAALFKMLQGLLGPELLGIISPDSGLYFILGMMYNAFFYFLPLFAAYTAANKLGTNPVLSMFLGGMLIVPEFVALADEGAITSLSLLGLPVPVFNYAQTILPIVLSVWVFSYVERFFKKVIPDLLSTIFVPFLSLAVMVPISLCVLAPSGSLLGDLIGQLMFSFSEYGGFVAIALIAASWNFLVMTGMHITLVTLAYVNFLQTGVEYAVFGPALVANFAVFGVALGAFLRLHDKDEKSNALGYLVSGFVGGVTEPTLYGLCLKFKRPFITMAIAAALGGMYSGLMHVGYYVDSSTNFMGLLAFMGGSASNMTNGIISCAIAMVSGAILTYMFGFSKSDVNSRKKNESTSAPTLAPAPVSAPVQWPITIAADAKGKVYKMDEVPDQVFSQGVLGLCCGIDPVEGKVFAPADGEVSQVADTLHAIGFTCPGGVEILIHVGIDTVDMNGAGFVPQVKVGDTVKAGQLVLTMDLEKIAAAGHPATVITVVTNSDDFANVDLVAQGNVEVGADLFKISN